MYTNIYLPSPHFPLLSFPPPASDLDLFVFPSKPVEERLLMDTSDDAISSVQSLGPSSVPESPVPTNGLVSFHSGSQE